MDTFPAAAYTCDAGGLITYFNAPAEAVWGRSPKLRTASDRYCGSHKLYSTDGIPIRHEECWMALALLEGHAYTGRRIVIERLDGGRTLGEAYACPLRNCDGDIIGAVNLVADKTAQHATAGARGLGHRPAIVSDDAIVAMIEIVLGVLAGAAWPTTAFA